MVFWFLLITYVTIFSPHCFYSESLKHRNLLFISHFFTLCWKIVAELFLEELYRHGLRDFSQSAVTGARISAPFAAAWRQVIFQVHGVIPHAARVGLHSASLLCDGAAGYMMDLSLWNARNVVTVIGNVCGMRKVASGPVIGFSVTYVAEGGGVCVCACVCGGVGGASGVTYRSYKSAAFFFWLYEPMCRVCAASLHVC